MEKNADYKTVSEELAASLEAVRHADAAVDEAGKIAATAEDAHLAAQRRAAAAREAAAAVRARLDEHLNTLLPRPNARR